MIDKLDLNTKAQQLREILGEDSNSPIDIFALANQIEKLTIIYYPLGNNISGICIKDDLTHIIAINSSMSYGRQRFSMAHELFHLYFDNDSGYSICSKNFNSKNDIEKQADQFATYFIAPYKALKDVINKIEGHSLLLKDIIYLEQYFGMSHQAMLWRLLSENIIKPEEFDKYNVSVTTIAKKLGYDDRLYNPSPIEYQRKTFGYYIKQIEELREKDLVSSGKIDELLLDAFREDIAFGLVEDEQAGEIFD